MARRTIREPLDVAAEVAKLIGEVLRRISATGQTIENMSSRPGDTNRTFLLFVENLLKGTARNKIMIAEAGSG